MRRLIGIVLVVIAGFFLFVAGKAIVTSPKTNKQLKEAPFITDGKVDPANEGKTVIVKLDFSDVGPAEDDEFGFTFTYPIVHRQVERYGRTVNGYEWENVGKDGDFPNEKYFYGRINGGDFEIEPSLLVGLGAGKDIKESDFDAAELNVFLQYYNGLQGETYQGIYYITDATAAYLDDISDESIDVLNEDLYKEQVGVSRVHYKGLSGDDIKSIALIGRQEGNRLVKDDRVDTLTVYENVENKDDLVRSSGFSLYIGVAIGALISLTILYFGGRMLIEG